MIGNKRKDFLTKWVLLLHNNTCLHSTAPTIEEIKQLKFNIFLHLPYGADLSSLNYYLFGPTKETLHWWRFAFVDDIKGIVHTWLWSQLFTLFTDGIRKLVYCYIILKKKGGDYFEKWYTLHLSQIVVHVVISKLTLLFDCSLYMVIN